MYELFTFWYGPPLGPELKRTKIFISSSNTLTLESKGNKKMDIDDDNSDDEGEKLSRNITSPFTGIDLKTSIKFEIEIFPVFLLLLVHLHALIYLPLYHRLSALHPKHFQ